MAKRKMPADGTDETNQLTHSGQGLQTETDPAAEAPVTPAKDAPPPEEQPRGRQSFAPVCPYHKQDCRAGSSNAFFTYYYCQVKGCTFSVKQPRPNMRSRLHEADEQQDHSAR